MVVKAKYDSVVSVSSEGSLGVLNGLGVATYCRSCGPCVSEMMQLIDIVLLLECEPRVYECKRMSTNLATRGSVV